MKKIITALTFILIFSNAYSYNSNLLLFSKKSTVEITDTTKKCSLRIISKKNYTDIYIFGLSDSSVKISNGEYSKEILIRDVKSITFKGSGFWKGAAIGGGIGLLAGILLGASLAEMCDDGDNCKTQTTISGGFIVGVPFALIGGLIGSASAKDKIYDLSRLDFVSKRKKIKFLIKEYSNS